jgi:hypothetical protein
MSEPAAQEEAPAATGPGGGAPRPGNEEFEWIFSTEDVSWHDCLAALRGRDRQSARGGLSCPTCVPHVSCVTTLPVELMGSPRGMRRSIA